MKISFNFHHHLKNLNYYFLNDAPIFFLIITILFSILYPSLTITTHKNTDNIVFSKSSVKLLLPSLLPQQNSTKYHSNIDSNILSPTFFESKNIYQNKKLFNFISFLNYHHHINKTNHQILKMKNYNYNLNKKQFIQNDNKHLLPGGLIQNNTFFSFCFLNKLNQSKNVFNRDACRIPQQDYNKNHEFKSNLEYEKKIDDLVNKNKIVVFMKGTSDTPRCGFSNSLIKALQACGSHKFVSVNVLDDDIMRINIKLYSDFPTIPQLYINGEFIGGNDIVQQMLKSGELKSMLNNTLS